jgi:hypothetical protein
MTGHTHKKNICFKDELTHVREFEKDPSMNVDEIWYSGEDYMDMKDESKMEAKQWRRRKFDVLLCETFQSPRSDAQDFINAFVLLDEERSRRGQERLLSKQHGQERRIARDASRFSVLAEQRKLLKSGADRDEIEQTLFQVYHPICQPGALFARRIALADELFVKKGEDSSHAEKILELHGIPAGGAHPRIERRGSIGSVDSANSFDSARCNNTRGPRRAGRRNSIKSGPPVPQEIGGHHYMTASIA